MKRVSAILGAFGLVLALSPPGWAQETKQLPPDKVTISGTIAEHRVMTATIDSIDKATSSMTFVGPIGWKYSRHIVDPSVFSKVKVGDRIDITWDADVTLSVEKPKS